MSQLKLISLNVFLVVVVLLHVVVPFSLVEVVVKTLLSTIFASELLLNNSMLIMLFSMLSC